MRWKLARPDVRSPAWGGTATDTRVAYLSGANLRVVAGDGTGDHLIGPAERFRWLPGSGHRLAVLVSGRTSVVDADTGAVVSQEVPPPARSARVRRAGEASQLVVGKRVRFEGTRTFRNLTWSPDGRWLALVWPEADQLVFVTATGARRIEAVANLTAEFEGTIAPRITGWCASG